MKLNFTTNNRNELLQRRELVGTLEFTGAVPSNQDLATELAKNTDQSLVVIKKIRSYYGVMRAQFQALIYDSVKDRDDIEPKPKSQSKVSEAKSSEA